MKTVVMAAVVLLSTSLAFAAKVGAPAPDFTGTSSHAKDISLAQYQGKYVVLQWHNKDCPYVQAHYGSGNMQKLQKEWTSKGVIWLTIVSSAVGKQGYVDGKGAEADVRATNAAPTATVLDPAGTIGRAYRAQTTPHMFVIDPQGTLIYDGAIDNRATTSKASVGGSVNYVSLALTEAMAGKPLSHPTSRPYGCSVKY
jgi:membrane peptidoglycan carboxypeptidase